MAPTSSVTPTCRDFPRRTGAAGRLVLGIGASFEKLVPLSEQHASWDLRFACGLPFFCTGPGRSRAARVARSAGPRGYEVQLPGDWLDNNPLTAAALTEETAVWRQIGRNSRSSAARRGGRMTSEPVLTRAGDCNTFDRSLDSGCLVAWPGTPAERTGCRRQGRGGWDLGSDAARFSGRHIAVAGLGKTSADLVASDEQRHIFDRVAAVAGHEAPCRLPGCHRLWRPGATLWGLDQVHGLVALSVS